MGRLIVQEWLSFDGVAQAPGEPDEDTSDGFRHGGWHLQYFDEDSMNWVLENVSGAGAYLLGRRTYEGFASHWPNASEEEQFLAKPLNTKPKHVATTTLSDPLEWENSTVLKGHLSDAVEELKVQNDGDLLVIGSTKLVHALAEHDVVDEYRLMVDPLILGGGKRVFPTDGERRPLRLVDSRVTTTGAMILTYQPDRG